MAYRLGPAIIFKADTTSWTTATVSGGIDTDDVDIPFSSGTGTLPSSGIVTIGTEKIYFGSSSTGHLLECVRGFSATTAATHADSTAISLNYVSFGKTLGGVTIELGETSNMLKTDQDGESPVDEVITGTTVSLKASLADITLDNFAFAHKTTVVGSSPNRKVVVYPNAGSSLLTNSAKVLLVPYSGTTLSTDVERYITIPKAGIKATEKLTFDASTQRIIELTLNSYVDSNNHVLIFGDESAT